MPVICAALVLLAVATSGCQEPCAAEGPAAAALPCPRAQLWQACTDEVKRRGFELDWVDWRLGRIESRPQVSSQWFEFWAHDLADPASRFEANLHLVRRRLSLRVAEADTPGQYRLECTAPVERWAPAPARMSGTVRAQSVLSEAAGAMPGLRRPEDERAGQWVSLGGDGALAAAVVNRITQVCATPVDRPPATAP